MKKLFDGECVALCDATLQKNLVIQQLLDQYGYTPYSTKLQEQQYMKDNAIGVNYRNRTVYTTFLPYSSLRRVSFEEFILEIFRPQPIKVELQLPPGRTALIEDNNVTVYLGYNTKEPVFSFEEIEKIKEGIDKYKCGC